MRTQARSLALLALGTALAGLPACGGQTSSGATASITVEKAAAPRTWTVHLKATGLPASVRIQMLGEATFESDAITTDARGCAADKFGGQAFTCTGVPASAFEATFVVPNVRRGAGTDDVSAELYDSASGNLVARTNIIDLDPQGGAASS